MSSLQSLLCNPFFINPDKSVYHEDENGFILTYTDENKRAIYVESVTQFEEYLENRYGISDVIWTRTNALFGISFSIKYTKDAVQYATTFSQSIYKTSFFEGSTFLFENNNFSFQLYQDERSTLIMVDFKNQIIGYFERFPKTRLKCLLDEFTFDY